MRFRRGFLKVKSPFHRATCTVWLAFDRSGRDVTTLPLLEQLGVYVWLGWAFDLCNTHQKVGRFCNVRKMNGPSEAISASDVI